MRDFRDKVWIKNFKLVAFSWKLKWKLFNVQFDSQTESFKNFMNASTSVWFWNNLNIKCLHSPFVALFTTLLEKRNLLKFLNLLECTIEDWTMFMFIIFDIQIERRLHSGCIANFLLTFNISFVKVFDAFKFNFSSCKFLIWKHFLLKIYSTSSQNPDEISLKSSSSIKLKIYSFAVHPEEKFSKL